MFVSIKNFALSMLLLSFSLATGCSENATAPSEAPSKVTITAPQFGFVEAYIAFPTTFAVTVCAPDNLSTPQIVAEIPSLVSTSSAQAGSSVITRAPAASVVGVNTEPDSARCSDGGNQYTTFVQIKGNQLGTAQGILFLKSDPSVKITFLVNVRYYDFDGQKG